MSRLEIIDMAGAVPVDGAPAAVGGADVLFNLGLMYSSGRTMTIDLVAAHKWFNLAAMRGRSDAIQLRAEIAAQMDAAEIALAQREARNWITAH